MAQRELEDSNNLRLFLGRLLLLTFAYFLLGSIGLSIPYIGSHVTMFWLPAGISVVALMRWGYAYWPGISLGAFLTAWLTVDTPAAIAAMIVVGNTLAPLICAHLLRRWRFDGSFSQPCDLVVLAIASSLGMLVSATMGVAVFHFYGVITPDSLIDALKVWWLGDMLGVLMALPFLMSLSHLKWDLVRQQREEFVLLCLSSIAVGLISFPANSFGGSYALPLAFLPMPLAVWAALRFGLLGGATAALWFSGLAAVSTGMGTGPFYLPDVQLGQLSLALFSATLATLALLVTSVHGRIRQSAVKLRQSASLYRQMFDASPLPMWVHELGTLRILAANDAAIAYYGYSREEFLQLRVPDLYVVQDPSLLRDEPGRGEFNPPYAGTWQHRLKNRQVVTAEVTSHLLNFQKKPSRVVLAHDVTEQLQAAARLKQSESRLHEAQRLAQIGSWEMLIENESLTCSDEVFRIFEIERKDELNFSRDFMLHVHPQDRHLMVNGYKAALKNVASISFECRLLFGESRIKWIHIRCSTYPNGEGKPHRVMGTAQDISSRKQTEQQIHDLAFYDLLTKLPNRRLLIDRLHKALASSSRSGQHGALLFIDLDHFKTLNDTRGHDVGDQLLLEVANRIRHCVRESDTAARFGGDEFVVMLTELDQDAAQAAAQVETVGEKLRDAIAHPYILGGEEYHGSPSIGVSLFRGEEQSVDQLLKQADVAMYQAKNAGRNALRFFDPAMQAALEARASLEAEMRRALPLNQFVPFYQVQISDKGEVLGAEVLLRWLHPERGLVSPAQFIPLAEETGLIVQIGQAVLEASCAQLKQWESDPLLRDIELSVNVSARQFRQSGFVTQVREALVSTRANPAKLKLELTETLILDNIADTVDKMNALKALGVGFSMDDFGTGHSSLAYLKLLPLDQLKIDQSFVRDIVTDPNDAVIVQTIIVMAQSLGLDVIAEGVETPEQLRFLQAKGCLAFQGYLFSRPVPQAEFEQLMHARPWQAQIGAITPSAG